jgi:hypothetical protein
MIISSAVIISIVFVITLTIMQRKNTAAHVASGLAFETRSFGTAAVLRLAYQDGRLAVALLAEDGETLATLSVNIPESAHLLGEGEFFAKTWSENEEIAEDALASGIFRDTGRTSGEVLNAKIWAFSKNPASP